MVAAGTYGAFQVNAFGQIVGYSAPPASGLALGATAPLHVAQDVSGTYVFTIDAATETTPGVVQLASGGDLAANVPIPSDRVISWGFLQLWWDRVKNFICDLTNVVELTAAQRASAKIPMCVDGTTVSVSPAELVSGGGGAFARVRMDNGTILSSDNVTSVLPSTGPHGELVSMTNPAGANYHVYATNYVPLLLVPLITIVSPTQFYVAWYQVDSTATLGSAAVQLPTATQWSAVVVRGEP